MGRERSSAGHCVKYGQGVQHIIVQNKASCAGRPQLAFWKVKKCAGE